MWLTIARILAFVAGGMIALRIARLVLLSLRRTTSNGSTATPAEGSLPVPARARSRVAGRQGIDRLLHWGFYVCMAMAMAAYLRHMRGI